MARRTRLVSQTWCPALHPWFRIALTVLAPVLIAGMLLPGRFYVTAAVIFVILCLIALLALGNYETLTLKAGRDGQPVLVCRQFTAFYPVRRSTHALQTYHALGLDTAVARQREMRVHFPWLLFILSAGTAWWFRLSDTGDEEGCWQLTLRREGEWKGHVVFEDRNLHRLKGIAAEITKASGLRFNKR